MYFKWRHRYIIFLLAHLFGARTCIYLFLIRTNTISLGETFNIWYCILLQTERYKVDSESKQRAIYRQKRRSGKDQGSIDYLIHRCEKYRDFPFPDGSGCLLFSDGNFIFRIGEKDFLVQLRIGITIAQRNHFVTIHRCFQTVYRFTAVQLSESNHWTWIVIKFLNIINQLPYFFCLLFIRHN